MLKASGPTNQRTYTVAVYFREKRLAVGVGGGIQQAEMKAAEAALNQPGGMLCGFKNVGLNLYSLYLTVQWIVCDNLIEFHELSILRSYLWQVN